MKKFVLKLIVSIALMYLVLLGIQAIVDFYLKKDNCCSNNTWSEIYESKIKADIVILGTSRAEVQYDTEIIKQITGLKTYNLGLSGTHYNILKIRWKAYLNHNSKPKILVLDLDDSAMLDSKEIYNKFQYLPYFNTQEYGSVAKEFDDDYYFEKYIPIYKYRGYEMSVYDQIKSLKDFSYCPKNVNGYLENDIKWIERDFAFLKKLKEKSKVKEKFCIKKYKNGLAALNEIIKDCKQNNIKVIFVWSPSYFEAHSHFAFTKECINEIVDEISKQNNIKYYNFSKDSVCLKRENFYNSMHMNKIGVAQFSRKIGKIINEEK